MNTNLDLKRTEKASYKLAAYADGTADLGLGLVFFLLGLYPFTREAFGPSFNMLFFILALGGIIFIQGRVRNRLVPGRIGVVKFGPRVKTRTRIAFMVMVVLSAVMITAWFLAAQGWFPGTPQWLGSFGFEILIAVIILAIFWITAYSLELQRYYLYGVLLAACFPLQASLSLYEGTPFLAAGGIITIIGIYLLVRFLREYLAADNAPEEN